MGRRAGACMKPARVWIHSLLQRLPGIVCLSLVSYQRVTTGSWIDH